MLFNISKIAWNQCKLSSTYFILIKLFLFPGQIKNSGPLTYVIFSIDFRDLSNRLMYLNQSCQGLSAFEKLFQTKYKLFEKQSQDNSSLRDQLDYKICNGVNQKNFEQIQSRIQRYKALCTLRHDELSELFYVLKDTFIPAYHQDESMSNKYFKQRPRRFLSEIFSILSLGTSVYNAYVISKLAKSVLQVRMTLPLAMYYFKGNHLLGRINDSIEYLYRC